ncbi:MAG: EutP/PduV family microcompartment system protein [Clostridia bacterium]|nr:EutP/PduV family microcompartment system protein [Clostridia bacterium]
MKKIMFVGRSEAGKTTLKQALKNQEIKYEKTQAIDYTDVIIDTPGEYIQTKELGSAIAVYAYEADVIGLLLDATEPYSLYPPCITGMCNREVIGIVTKINDEDANVERAKNWLRLAGCQTIFPVDSVTGEGVDAIRNYLLQEKVIKNHKNKEKTTF